MSEAMPEAAVQPATATSEPTVSELQQRLADLEADRDKWQSMSRKQEERAKSNADKAKRFDDLEAATKSDLERVTERATAAEGRASALAARAAKAEIRALAANTFADPSDAAAFIDLDGLVGDDGDVDTKRVEKALAELLKQKPHLSKQQAPPSFDGGARTTAGAPADMNALIRSKAGLG